MRQTLSTSDLLKIAIPALPRNEQDQIVGCLDKRVSTFNDGIECDRSAEIKALDDYKTRLISDAVTGKINVRDVTIPEYDYVSEDLSTGADPLDKENEKKKEQNE